MTRTGKAQTCQPSPSTQGKNARNTILTFGRARAKATSASGRCGPWGSVMHSNPSFPLHCSTLCRRKMPTSHNLRKYNAPSLDDFSTVHSTSEASRFEDFFDRIGHFFQGPTLPMLGLPPGHAVLLVHPMLFLTVRELSFSSCVIQNFDGYKSSDRCASTSSSHRQERFTSLSLGWHLGGY